MDKVRLTGAAKVLVAIELLVAVTAGLTGLLLFAGPLGGLMQVSPEWLNDTPFRTYLVPGLVLFAVVGGTQLAAGVLVLRRARAAVLASALAGATLCGWLVVQVVMVDLLFWLQYLHLGFGLLELGLAAWLWRSPADGPSLPQGASQSPG